MATPKLKSNYAKAHMVGSSLVLRPYKFSDFKKCRTSYDERLPSQDKFDIPINAGADSNLQKFKERVQRHRRIAKGLHHFIFGLFEKESGKFVGQVDLMTINQQLRWCNLGYNIHSQFRKKGYASEGARLAMKVAFQKLNFHRLEAAMEMDNQVSEKVAIRIGLKFEGKREKFFPEKGGIDMKVYATNAIDFK